MFGTRMVVEATQMHWTKMVVEATLHMLKTKLAEVKTQEGYGGRWHAVTFVKRAREPKRLDSKDLVPQYSMICMLVIRGALFSLNIPKRTTREYTRGTRNERGLVYGRRCEHHHSCPIFTRIACHQREIKAYLSSTR
jgi:hypothetical protein